MGSNSGPSLGSQGSVPRPNSGLNCHHLGSNIGPPLGSQGSFPSPNLSNLREPLYSPSSVKVQNPLEQEFSCSAPVLQPKVLTRLPLFSFPKSSNFSAGPMALSLPKKSQITPIWSLLILLNVSIF